MGDDYLLSIKKVLGLGFVKMTKVWVCDVCDWCVGLEAGIWWAAAIMK
jgi:hypothetical protein